MNNKKYIYPMAFLLPLIPFLIAMVCLGIYPFGHRSLLIIDGVQQYLPFFTELKRKLTSGESLLYSWNAGLGHNFWALFCYYLSSPFNVILLFFKESHINEAVTFILISKVSTASLTMTYYLQHKKASLPLVSVALGVMYALSNYVLAYSSNIMWMDAVILLPLLALSIENFVIKKHTWGYPILLFLCLITNYYIGFMLCVFSVLYFILHLVLARKESNASSTKGRIPAFMIASCFGGCLGAVNLIPSAINLANTSSATTLTSSSLAYPSFITQMTALLPLTKPVITSENNGEINLYCGIGILFFLLLFFSHKKISNSRKIGYGLLSLFFLLCCSIPALNTFIHGMHAPYGYPNRHVFILVFLLLSISYQGLVTFDIMNNKCYLLGFLSMLIAGFLCVIAKRSLYETLGILTILLILICICCGFFKESHQRGRFRTIFSLLFLLITLGEILTNGTMALIGNGSSERDNFLTRKNYILEEVAKETNQSSFFRSDITVANSMNETMYIGEKGVAYFSSTISKDVLTFLSSIGFFTSTNTVKNYGYTEFSNLLLNVKYNQKLARIASLYGNSPITSHDILNESTYYGNMGFLVDKKPDSTSYQKLTSPFACQNQIATDLTGGSLYDVSKGVATPISTKDNAYACEFSVSIAPNSHAYLSLKDTSITSVSINGMEYKKNLTRCYDLGTADQDRKECHILITTTWPDTISYEIGQYSLERMTSIADIMASKGFTVTNYTDATLTGTITSKEQSAYLLTSIPFDKGFNVYVDGSKVSTFSSYGALLTIPIEKGVHSITMKYTPSGFVLGAIISILCTSFGILYVIVKMKRRSS